MENFITNIDYVIVFSLLILPGFLIMKIIRFKVPHKEYLMKDILYESFSYSILNLVIFSWIPYLAVINDYKKLALLLIVVVAIVGPFCLAFLYIKIINSKIFKKNFDIQVPTAWDWFFMQKPNCILMIHLKNGEKVIGYYADNSYATSFPNHGSIYLEKLYRQNDESIELVENSGGILIKEDEYTKIEIFNLEVENGR